MDRAELLAASRPEALAAAAVAAGAQGHQHPHGAARASVRTLAYEGHEIVVRTTYEIRVDGREFPAAVDVDNTGRVSYHGLATRDFASTVELVQKAIDLFPDDFAPPGPDGSGDPSAPEQPGQPGHHDSSGHAGHAAHGGA